MRCVSCDYLLEGLRGPEFRCPECGQVFDPHDASTFIGTPRSNRAQRKRAMRIIWVVLLIVVGIAVAAMALSIATSDDQSFVVGGANGSRFGDSAPVTGAVVVILLPIGVLVAILHLYKRGNQP